MSETNPFEPAFQALAELREDITKRVGKEGGNLNRRMLGNVSMVEVLLKNVMPVRTLDSMLNVIQQQAQLATYTFRTMSKALEQGAQAKALANGDNGESETKGQ